MRSIFAALFVCSFISGYAHAQGAFDNDVRSPIKIMQYNVENLFDAVHDDGKQDYEFLPKNDPQKANCEHVKFKNACYALDWTPAKIAIKLNQIRKIVMAQGTLPDVLVMEEVENESIVTRLGSVLGYQFVVMTNSPDQRGIDVAILYRTDRLRFINQFQARLNIGFATRDLLVANFQTMTGDVLGIFANHWPSQLTPGGTARYVVAQQLRTFVDSVGAKFGDKYHAILMGDFNTIDADRPHPFKEVILNKDWPRRFASARALYEQGGGRGLPPGTFYFAKDHVWNEFDLIFASGNLYDGQGLDLMIDSFRVNAPEWATKVISMFAQGFDPAFQRALGGDYQPQQFQSAQVRVPKGYDHNATNEADAGYSDHFGILVKIKTGGR